MTKIKMKLSTCDPTIINMTPSEYVAFGFLWNQRYAAKFQIRQQPYPFPLNPTTDQQASQLTLLDILEYWYGKQKEYLLFHTTNHPSWKLLQKQLSKQGDHTKQLKGDGLLGKGFYMTPNPRTSFLYGTKSIDTIFRDKVAFIVFLCKITREDAKQLKYYTDVKFHDTYTTGRSKKHVNANNLQHLEITLVTPIAKNSLHLENVIHVTGVYPSRQQSVFVSGDQTKLRERGYLDDENTSIKWTRNATLPFESLLYDVPYQCVKGFGTVFRISKFVRFIIFDGVIQTLLDRFQTDDEFTLRFRDLILAIGVDVRIHFNAFSKDNIQTTPAKCFIVNGVTAPFNPETFFDSQVRREYKDPFCFVSTSLGPYKPVLVIPPYDPTHFFQNIFRFAQSASDVVFLHFFRYSAMVIKTILGITPFETLKNVYGYNRTLQSFVETHQFAENGCYVNFHGGSVGWLHLRVDELPAYYNVDEFLLLHSQIPVDGLCPLRSAKRLEQQKKKQERLLAQQTKKRAMMLEEHQRIRKECKRNIHLTSLLTQIKMKKHT